MGRIIVYTTSGCPYSLRVKLLLEKKKVPFIEINLTDFPQHYDDMILITKGKRSVPQIFFESEYIGGLDEFLQLQNSGNLDAMIEKTLRTEMSDLHQNIPKPIKKRPSNWTKLKLDPVLEDAYRRLRDPEKGLSLKTRLGHSNTFKGSALIKWLSKNNKSTEEEAMKLGEKLRLKGYFYRLKDHDKPLTNDSSLYRFQVDVDPDVLNGRMLYNGDARSALDVALYLQETITTLYEEHTSRDDGVTVDYEAIKRHKDFGLYCDATLELHKVDISSPPLKAKDVVLFFVTMYRNLSLHAEIVMGGRPRTKSDRIRFYQQLSYTISGQRFTLEAIEQVLRGKPRPSGWGAGITQATDTLKRLLSKKEVTKPPYPRLDPRVHFALIFPEKYSPPIRLFDSNNLDFGLQWATELFLADVDINKKTKTVTLPMLFKWYKSEFGRTSREILNWIVMFLPDDKEAKLRELLLANPGDDSISVDYKKRPWESEGAIEGEDAVFEEHNGTPNITAATEKSENDRTEEEDEMTMGSEAPRDVREKINEALESQAATLELKDIGLETLPNEFFQKRFEFCRKLVLSKNNIRAIPTKFTVNLSNIAILYLNENSLRAIPPHLANLRHLESLDLSNNQISLIANRFCTLRNLRVLNLSFNKLQSLPIGFAQLKQLEELMLSHNEITELRDNFCELNNLEILDLSFNQLTALPDMSGFVRLEELYLSHNKLTILPPSIEEMKHLVIFDLSHNDLKELPNEISGLVKLAEFSLVSNKLKKIPKAICDLHCNHIEFGDNPLQEPPKEVCQEGIEAIRKFFGWVKPPPPPRPTKRQISRSNLDENRTSTGSIQALLNQDGMSPREKANTLRRLSTNEKRALLVKRVVVKKFDTETLNQIRQQSMRQDITALLSHARDTTSPPTTAININLNVNTKDSKSTFGGPSSLLSSLSTSTTAPITQQTINQSNSPPGSSVGGNDLSQSLKMSTPLSGLVQRDREQLILYCDGFRLEKTDKKHKPTLDDLTLLEYNYIFDYQTVFYGKSHVNFVGMAKELGGPVLISISLEGLDDDSEPQEKTKFGSLRFKRKAKTPSLPNFFAGRVSKDKERAHVPLGKGTKRESTENLFSSIKLSTSNSSAVRTTSRHLELRSSRGVLSDPQSSSTVNPSNVLPSSKDVSITPRSSMSIETVETSRNDNKTASESSQIQESESDKADDATTSPRKKLSNSHSEQKTKSLRRERNTSKGKLPLTRSSASLTHDTPKTEPTTDRSPKTKTASEVILSDKGEKERRHSHDHSKSATKSDLQCHIHSHSVSNQSDSTSPTKKRFSAKIEGLGSISELDEKSRESIATTKAISSPHPTGTKLSNEERSSKRENRRQRHSTKVHLEGSEKEQTNSSTTPDKAEKVSTPKKEEKKDDKKNEKKTESKTTEKEPMKLEEQKGSESKMTKFDDKTEERDKNETEESPSSKERRHRPMRALSAFQSPAATRRKASGDIEAEKPNSPKSPSPKSEPSSVLALIRTRKLDRRITIPLKSGGRNKHKPKQLLKALKETYPEYSGITFKHVKNEDINEEFLNLELRLSVKGYKYGVLYCKAGQTDEEAMFSNNDPSPDFEEFLSFLGEKIVLKGWEGYSGGLDTQKNTTGTHSIFTKYRDYSIMFHVSTMLPFSPEDSQQVERKRHIGNDIVVIIFQEGTTPFYPGCIRSYFNHVFFVVRKEVSESGKTMYRLATTSKTGVSVHKPPLPEPPVFEKGPFFRDFFFTKLINAERACYSAPGFSSAIERTRADLMETIVETYLHND